MMTDRIRSGKNAGFSLVELLVGVMILSIVVAPLLHAIITSANVAKESRTMQNETLVAKNVVETINSMRVSDILTTAKVSGGINGLSTASQLYKYDSVNDSYTALSSTETAAVKVGDDVYLGLPGVTASTSTYDAMVKLDAGSYPQNDNQVSVYTPMSAVYSQLSDVTEGGSTTLRNPDTIAATTLESEATLLSGTAVTPGYFAHRMVRHVKINIVQSGANVTATAEYSYTAPYTYISTPAVYAADGTTIITEAVPSTVMLPADPATCRQDYVFYTGSVDDFDSVYFFYFPNYNTLAPSGSDNITVYNNNGLPFTFFLIKQYTPGLTDAELDSFENAYNAVLALREPAGTQTKPYATIYTNMKVILNDGDDLDFNSSLLLMYNGVWFNYGVSTGKLVATDDLKRLYKVTVDLYPAGTGFTGTPKLVFDATKLD